MNQLNQLMKISSLVFINSLYYVKIINPYEKIAFYLQRLSFFLILNYEKL